MKTALQIFRKHPVAMIFSVLYGLLWFDYLNVSHKFRIYRMQGHQSVAFGEGVAYTMLLTLLFGFVFTLIILINAIFKKEQRGFYLILSALIALPILLFFMADGA